MNGTPIWAIYQQLELLPFELRWQKHSINYTTHLLRAPKSGLLHELIQKKWWKPIRKLYTEKDDLNLYPDIDTTIINKFPSLHLNKNSHILQLFNMAAKFNCSDSEFITKTMKYKNLEAFDTTYYLIGFFR